MQKRFWKLFLVSSAIMGALISPAPAQSPWPTSSALASVSEIASYVRTAGWPADLNYLCAALEINVGPRCLFLQVAVHRRENTIADHGFNVPADSAAPAQIVLYHVTPLVGEFFLATAEGKLLKALSRSRSTAFETMPSDQAASAYGREVEFWQGNLAQVKRDVERQKATNPPPR